MWGSAFCRHPPGRGPACHPAFPHLLGAAGNYENPALGALIRALKFRGVKSAAEPLADILATYMLPFAAGFKNYLVVPIPLSRKRLCLRGFNQSEFLAKRFAERFALPLETGHLVRVKHAKPQSETKSAAERRKNIRGCFAVTAGTEIFRGKNIILVDDVSTSGATFLEAAQALRSAGAANLCALAAAKA